MKQEIFKKNRICKRCVNGKDCWQFDYIIILKCPDYKPKKIKKELKNEE
jgi:hypothetical protein